MFSFKKPLWEMPACGEAFIDGHPCLLPIERNQIKVSAAELAGSLKTTPENLIISTGKSAEIYIVLTTFNNIPSSKPTNPQKILTGTVLDVPTYLKLVQNDAPRTGIIQPIRRYLPYTIRLGVTEKDIFKFSFSRGESTGNFGYNFSKWLLLRLPKPKKGALINLEKESLT